MSEIRDADLEKVYTDQREFFLGQEVELHGLVFIFVRVQVVGQTTPSDSLWAVHLDSAYPHFDVTCDTDHADALCDLPIGQLQAAPSDGEMCFAQKKGWNRKAVTTDGSAAQDQKVAVSDTTPGVLWDQSGTDTLAVGTPTEDDTGTELAAGKIYYFLP